MDIRKSKMAWVLIIVSFLLFILLILAVNGQAILAFDTELAHFIHTLFPASFLLFWEGMSSIADKIGIGIIAFLFILFLWWKKKDFVGIAAFVFCVGLGNELNKWVKDLVARPRPRPIAAAALETDSYSFPSGHAMVGLLLYLFIAHILAKEIKGNAGKLILAAIAFMVILLIGISRIVLEAHYPTDVIGGYLLGGIWLFVWVGLYETFYDRFHKQKGAGTKLSS
ncbi:MULTISPECIES: phosphatase PAP2 family protein [Niallia]|uniref:phosphatase PAP2 family protein n=1 Tax=Niallia TaxID=2837506 RepID=UPI0013D68EC5|nr:phosphatase PAP2 family protein [Niallia circulans]NRG27907.1 phosphatase PAP2 family protein [Niallia circulans]QJX61290.1 phosphatase PAP2 family protein [Niallia circulans]